MSLPPFRSRLIPALALTISVVVAGSAACACRGRKGADAGARPDSRVHGLSPAQAREVLARVGDETITLGDFAERLAAQSPYLRARFNSPERRREMLDDMIRFELLVQEAERLGLDRDPAVARVQTQALVDELLRTEVDARLSRDSITDADARAFYDAHATEWNQPEQVRASHLRFADRGAAQRALVAVRAAPNDTELFRRLAREQSNDEATRNSGGDLRFFSRPQGSVQVEGAPPVAVAEAAFVLTTPGEIVDHLVQADDGFHVVKLTARRQPMSRSFEEVKPIVVDRIFRDRRASMIAELVARLRREAYVQEDQAALATIHVDTAAPAPHEEEEE